MYHDKKTGLWLPEPRSVGRFWNAFDSFGSGGEKSSGAPTAAAGYLPLTIAGSDDPSSHGNGEVVGATLDNGGGGSGTRTWGVIGGTGSIAYASGVFQIGTTDWYGAYVNSYAMTGSAVGLDVYGVTPTNTGSECRIGMRGRVDNNSFLIVQVNAGAAPLLRAYNGSYEFSTSFTGITAHAAGVSKDYFIRVEDTGATEITVDIKVGDETDQLVLSGVNAGHYIGTYDAWVPFIQRSNDDTPGGTEYVNLGIFAFGTWAGA